MNEVVMLRGAEPREILQTVIEKKTPAIMSYLSRGKWHVAKVLLTGLGANRFDVEVRRQSKDAVSPRRKNVALEKPVEGGAQRPHPII